MTPKTIKLRARKRFEFIEFQLMWEGAVGRKILQDKFEISPQQATLDLTSYLDLAPKNMVYDPRLRTYVAAPGMRPKFLKGEASEYLMHLETLHYGYHLPEEIWPASIPSFDAVTAVSRKVDPNTLKEVLHAIREHQCVEVMYVSFSSSSDSPRRLFPHAIASDGHRWHMRAFDRDKERYSDFVLSRIEKITAKECDASDLPEDTAWSTFTKIRLQPDPDLSQRQKDRLQIEYDMEDSELTIRVRQAMLYYYLRFYGFNPQDIDGNHMRNKSSFHLAIANLEEVETCLGRRS